MVEERTMTLAQVEREIAALRRECGAIMQGFTTRISRANYIDPTFPAEGALCDVIMDAYHQPLADLEAERDSILLEMERRR